MDICLDDINKAKQMIDIGTFALVLVKEGQLYKFSDSGVKRLIMLCENSPQLLNGAYVCDKIVGKAAAALLILGGVAMVYAKVISKAGLSFLQDNNIKVEYGECVSRIINRAGDGFCPIEEATLPAITAQQAFGLIKQKLKQLAVK